MSYDPRPHYPLHHHLPTHDPAAVDFRAFYPYTPNEVKHRRRTTSAQLKILEAVFRVDTKPNATLRNDLAAQLGMTARGVQVWFQNRRAKEKNRANKKSHTASSTNAPSSATGSSADSTTPNPDCSPNDEDDADPVSPPATPGEELLEELLKSDSPPPTQHPEPQLDPPSPAVASPPKLHVVTDPALRPASATLWKPTPPVETPPDSAGFPSRPSLDVLQRRGSLPANVFIHPYSTTSTQAPYSIDDWNFQDRRRSVDIGLQRLLSNPYADLARARNVALLPQPHSSRQHSIPRKKSSLLRRPFLPHQPPSRAYLDMRRASMDPRSLMSGRADGFSPSPSPLPLYPVRASLPDTSLYATSRRYTREIPAYGPLPAPGFTFGAASASSPTDDDPPSPDLSSYSFPPKDDAAEDDDVTSSFSFGNLSRFGSAVSIATSESSVFSNPGFYDIGDLAPDQERRGSCESTHHAQLPRVAPGLDLAVPTLQSPTPVTADGYFDENSTCRVLAPGINLGPQTQPDDVSPASSFSSPASTASPDTTPTTQPSTSPVNISVSNTTRPISGLSTISRKLGLSSCAPLPLDTLTPSEQQEQQLSGRISKTQMRPPSQQQMAYGHQTRGVKNDPSFIFDDGPESRIDMTTTAIKSNQPIVPTLLSCQSSVGAQPMNEQQKVVTFSDGQSLTTTRDQANGQGDYTTQYLDLMDGFGFGTVMLDDESTTSMTGQGGCGSNDTLARLGLDISVGDFITNGAVPSFSPGPVTSGITTNQPTFDVAFGS